MNSTLVALGQIAGISGIAVGVVLLVFRDIIRKSVLRNLPRKSSYKLMRLIILSVWSIAALAMVIGYMPNTIAIQWNAIGSQQNVNAGDK